MLGQDPGNPDELIVPLGRILHIPQRGTTLKDIAEMPYRLGGRAAKPQTPLAFRTGTDHLTMAAGLGVTEAAELQDTLYALYERQRTRPDWRDELGLPPRDTLLERIREHMANKTRYFKQHAVTDPGEAPRTKRLY